MFVLFFVLFLILRFDVTIKLRIGTSMGLSCLSASASKESLTLTLGFSVCLVSCSNEAELSCVFVPNARS